jgi:hypothetical protein
MIEFLLEIFGEILIQFIVEALAEAGLHTVNDWRNYKPNPWLAGVGYALFGAIAGAVTVWLLPHHMVHSEVLRKLNLLVTPLAAGGMMYLVGAWRAKRGDPVLGIDRFAYGYVFALSLALVRFVFAQ